MWGKGTQTMPMWRSAAAFRIIYNYKQYREGQQNVGNFGKRDGGAPPNRKTFRFFLQRI